MWLRAVGSLSSTCAVKGKKKKKTEEGERRETGREKTEADSLRRELLYVSQTSGLETRQVNNKNWRDRKGGEQGIWSEGVQVEQILLKRPPSTIKTRECPATVVAADPGSQHDLPLSSGHSLALASGSTPPLSRPGLHLAAGGGRRCCSAAVPASFPREQPTTLGQYITLQ